jgi:cytochrome P450
VKNYPTTSILDLGRLASRFGWSAARHPRSFDVGRIAHDWMKGLTSRYGPNLCLKLGPLRMLLVSDRELSRHILADYPRSNGYTAGTLKRKGMSYLAPRALTIAEGMTWQRLRPFNERVLCTGRPHEYQRVFLSHVNRAFSAPITGVDDLRKRMGEVMLSIVFGEGVAPKHLATDIQALLGLVQNPVKRWLRGSSGRRRVKEYYDTVRRIWENTNGRQNQSLVAMAREAGDGADPDTLLQQIPHWMFTFSGSGSDLLWRGLAMMGSRPQAFARARAEIAAAGPLDDPTTIERLSYVQACLLESARLYPPVKATFHRAPEGDAGVNPHIPPGTELLHVFALTQRDRMSDQTADDFLPERWLGSGGQAEVLYPNLFLSGARRCPGRDLILFVCKAAAAQVMGKSGVVVGSDRLAKDPVPFSFPTKHVRIQLKSPGAAPPLRAASGSDAAADLLRTS